MKKSSKPLVVARHGIAASVTLLRQSRVDLVCPYPRQLAEGYRAMDERRAIKTMLRV